MPQISEVFGSLLEHILLTVHRRACDMAVNVQRIACILASGDARLSTEEQETFQNVGHSRLPTETVWNNDRLRDIAGFWRDEADRQMIRIEALRLKMPIHRKIVLEVAREFFLSAAERVVDFLKPRNVDGCNRVFSECCHWLATKGEEHIGQRPLLVRAAELLNSAEFSNEFLGLLWRECPEECKAIRLPEILVTTPKDLIKRAVVIERFHVSPSTLLRAVKDKEIMSFRPAGAAANAAHEYSETEIAKRYPRRAGH